jgi:hypothetical protein
MYIKIENDKTILEPQTALDHIFIKELAKCGHVDEAYFSSLQVLGVSCPALKICH